MMITAWIGSLKYNLKSHCDTKFLNIHRVFSHCHWWFPTKESMKMSSYWWDVRWLNYNIEGQPRLEPTCKIVYCKSYKRRDVEKMRDFQVKICNPFEQITKRSCLI